MKTLRWTYSSTSFSMLLISACSTIPISDNILFSVPPLGDTISEQVAELNADREKLTNILEEAGPGYTPTADEKAPLQLVEYFGPDQKHTGEVGLLMGIALGAPDDYEFDLSFGDEARNWTFKKEDFIPNQRSRRNIEAAYGLVDTLYVEATDINEPRITRPLIVHCYGNGANLYNNATITALDLLPYGDVLQFEYPGFSGGTAEERRALQKVANFDPMTDALAADLNTQTLKRPLIFWGHSLGGVVCANLAAKVIEADGLVLEATGNDVDKIARAVVPAYAKPFVRLKIDETLREYRIDDMLKDFNAPILVLGAKKDKTLSVGLARRLHKTLQDTGRSTSYVEFATANHVSIKSEAEFGEVTRAYITKLTSGE